MRAGSRCGICGKRRYATAEAAEAVIAKASDRRQEIRAYYVHGWWHLTSTPLREDEPPDSPAQGRT
jgi:hypothetical protein